MDLEGRLQYGLYNFGAGDNARGALGLAGFGLGALRAGLSGYGAGKNDKRVMDKYFDQQYNEPPKYEYEEGGKTVADLLTGNYITDTPSPNVEVEDGEYVKNSQTQRTQLVVGDKHKDGGVKVNLPKDSKVLSDYTKIGAENSKKIREALNIDLKANNTFADALDKYKSKVKFNAIEKEETELMKAVEKQIKSSINEKTKNVNLDFLSRELEEIQSKKTEIQQKIDSAFEFLFTEQEKLPKKNKPFMQEGGQIPPEVAQLAEQHGISPEKAMELIAQQQEQTPQGGDIMQQVMSMLQQGASPEQIVQELVSAGYPQEQAVSIIEQVMAQAQNSPQQEVPVNEEGMPMAQEGIRVGSSYEDPKLFKKQSATDVGWSSFGELLKSKPKEVLSEIKRLHPELYSTFFKGDKIPSKTEIYKFQVAVNNKYNNILNDAVTLYGENSEEVKTLKTQIEDDKFLTDDKDIRSTDSMLGNWTATRPNYQLNILPKEELGKVRKEGVNTAFELQSKFPDLYNKYVKDKGLSSDFWIGEQTPKVEARVDVTPAKEEKTFENVSKTPTIQNRQVKKNIIPLLPYFPQMTPDAMILPKKQEVNLSRIETPKIGVEGNIQENERARIARAISYANLSPEVASAMEAADLISTQMANNQAVSSMNVANAQSEFQEQQYNNGQTDREKLTNLGLDKQFERETLSALNNQSADWQRWFNSNERQQRANYENINELNLFNARNPNYQYNPNSGVEFVNPYTFNNEQNKTNKDIAKLLENVKDPKEYARLRDAYLKSI